MKKLNIIILLVVALGFVSCSTTKYMMSEEEIAEKKYTIDGWNVLKNGTVVGRMSAMEWEIYNGKMSREISISTSFSTDAEMQEIARFVHTKFPNDKIEVNEDDGNSFPKD